MLAWTRYAEGLMIAHAFLVVSFLMGASLIPTRIADTREAPASINMVRLVCTSGLGLAVIGLLGLLLAFAGLLSLPFLTTSLLACIVLGSLRLHPSLLTYAYWRNRVVAIARSWNPPLLMTYLVMVVLAFPAVNPANLGFDAVEYHLAYAADWATAGRLIVDPFLRWPFYASNFSVLYSALILMHAQAFIIFLVWTTGLLTALGICAVATLALESQGASSSWFTAFLLMLSVVLSPTYLRYLSSAYIDVPIGAFNLLTILAIFLAVRESRKEWLVVAAVTAGYLIGLKSSFIVLVPGFLVILWLGARSIGLRRRDTTVVFLTLLITASPWYIRNLVAAGDPIAPVLNIAIYGQDGLISKSELTATAADLPAARTPKAVATLPLRAFLNANSEEFREYGTTSLLLVLYVAPLILLALFFAGRSLSCTTVIVTLSVLAFGAYWAISAALLRYSLLFYPLLAICLALLAQDLLGNRRWRALVTVAVAALATLPTPGSTSYYHQLYLSQFRYLPESLHSDSQFLSLFAEGYKEEEFTAAIIGNAKAHGRVYVLGPPLQYYFRLHKIISMGDWIGPAGYFRLDRAIDAGAAPSFIESLGASAVLVDPSHAVGALDVPLGRQLQNHGFYSIRIPNSTYALYIRRGSLASMQVH